MSRGKIAFEQGPCGISQSRKVHCDPCVCASRQLCAAALVFMLFREREQSKACGPRGRARISHHAPTRGTAHATRARRAPGAHARPT